MRILQLHCDSIGYEPTKKEIQSAEEVDPKPVSIDEVVVCFTAIEKDDNEDIAKDAIREVQESMKKIGCSKLLLYPYAHLSSDLASPSTALSLLKIMEDSADGLEVSRAPFGWTKSYNIKVKGHPLAESSKVITADSKKEHTSAALESESKIKSYWYIMTPDGEMSEFTKFNFSNHKKLEVLAKYESAKKRSVDEPPPHVALMKKLAIADYEHASDQGNMRYFPNGRLIKSQLEQYVTNKVKEYGGYEVETPIMYDSHHPSMESYFNRFPARQYSIDSEGKHLFLRFAACFGQFLMAHDFQMSYKNLPYRLYELTRYSFRREQSGELVGLRRLRAFTMPDCHAFCSDMPQAVEEFRTRFDLSRDVLNGVGITQDDYEMAIRFTEDFYNENKDLIIEMVKKIGKPVLVQMWKERFFYFVLKWEFNYIDNSGKASALSTDQIDVENGSRYGIEFVDENNTPKNPIILHNSPSGAIERCLYALLEKSAKIQKEGKTPTIPFWLCPTQIRVIPLSQDFHNVSLGYLDELSNSGFRSDFDDRDLSVGKKVREAEKEWIPFILVVGKNEVESNKFQVRDRYSGEMITMSLFELTEHCKNLSAQMISDELPLPKFISNRPQFK